QTRVPAAASASTVARPIPEPPPTTIAELGCLFMACPSIQTTYEAGQRMRGVRRKDARLHGWVLAKSRDNAGSMAAGVGIRMAGVEDAGAIAAIYRPYV